MQALAILPLDRPNISEHLAVTLRDMIVDGRLRAGDRINEVQLAAALGVSRTPLREALGRLTAEGALTSVPRIGWFVRPLTVEEFREIYPIRGILDPEALRLAGLPSPMRIQLLQTLNNRIREATTADKTIALDDQFHLELIAGCPNRVLLDLVEQFMRRTRRYELALMREKKHVRSTIDEHAKIISALRAGKLDAACRALRHNMEIGVAPVVAWLEARQ
jgi:DNA-binding GntR family transcriptional regulator